MTSPWEKTTAAYALLSVLNAFGLVRLARTGRFWDSERMIERLAKLRWPVVAWVLAGGMGLFCGCKTRPQPKTAAPVSPHALETFDQVWRIVSDTHYDTNYGGVDWNAIRDEFRPRAATAQSERETRRIVQAMLDRLGISHTTVIPASRAGWIEPKSAGAERKQSSRGLEDPSGEPGFEFRQIGGPFVVTRVEPQGPADLAGIKPGWIVQSIGGVPVPSSGMEEPSSPQGKHEEFLRWNQVVRQLKGPPGEALDLEFLDGGGRTVSMAIRRRENQGIPVKLGFLPVFYARMRHETIVSKNQTSIGYLQFNVWMLPLAAALDQAIDELRGCDGIVLDLRGNVGGVAAMTIGFSGYFLDKPLLLGVMKTRETELTLTANPRTVNSRGESVETFGKPLAILVDGISASASEMFAGAMQSLGRARIFGTPTLGEVLPAVCDKLPNGDIFLHAFGDFRTASGLRLEGRGVVPDTQATLTREALLAGRDSVLEAALDWIEQRGGKEAPGAMKSARIAIPLQSENAK